MKHSSSPAYSIGTKYPAEPDTTNRHSPSPQTYNLRDHEALVPCAKFSKAPRSVSANKPSFPGPGAYPISTFIDKIIGKKGKRKNMFKVKEDYSQSLTPGPGTYTPARQETKISYTMGNKISNLPSLKENQPIGPGEYSPKYSSIKPSQSKSFTKSERYSKIIESSPGPCLYNSFIKSSSPVHTFSRDIKVKPEVSITPAPNSYSIPSFTEKTDKGKTMNPKRTVKNDYVGPGPGQYTLKVGRNSPSFTIGNGKRLRFTNLGDSPGPAKYCVELNKSQGKSIGKSNRPALVYDTKVPGPGQYETKSFIDIGPKYAMVGKKEGEPINDEIGPGKYDPNYFMPKAHSFCATIGRGGKTSQTKAGPGPGAYDVKDFIISPEWSFGKDARIGEDNLDEPGPGHYEFKPTVPDVPRYANLGRRTKN